MAVTADQEPPMVTSAVGTSSDATALGASFQVFLSFRRPDTRRGFTDTLYHALVDAGVRVFGDDAGVRVGETIGGALLRAIDDSKLYIPSSPDPTRPANESENSDVSVAEARRAYKLVATEVLDNLKTKHRSVTEHLIGMDDRVATVQKLLDVHAGSVWLVGIHGMGDIGKIDDVGYGMKRIEETLCNKKALIVLDDMDKSEQIKKLIGSFLHSGTRIIITTRNRSLLQIRGFKYEILPYEMREMNSKDALQLFSWHAFCGDSPPDVYNHLSKEIVSVTGGLPLALEAVGSLLYLKEEVIWIETLDKLRSIPEEEVQKNLKISFDVLDEFQQHIFRDITCFFVNEDVTDPIYMWTADRNFPQCGIEVLINMSLIKLVKNNKLWMHDQLRDLGREIVYQESPIDPWKRRRLWIKEEILNIIRSKERKGKIQGLDLNGRHTQILLTNDEFERIPHLRFLKLCNGTFVGDFANCGTKLRWMSWDSPPPDFRVANMYLQNVVVLKLSTNRFNDSDVWSLIKMASKSKVLSLQDCPSITRTPNVSGCSTLERLTLQECENLRTIDCSIGMLKCLIDLDIDSCPLSQRVAR
ncbi:disease resistance protein L6-like [Rhodamnia argentea]|uniref:Disease resistance protein L6-like n=1 Tax=Rhodamnia argentea TaxID=178133 RepID=A0A8B8NLW4_9MYRT|nr:disease resistance protein L6-like [Rhodamnia argentea]